MHDISLLPFQFIQAESGSLLLSRGVLCPVLWPILPFPAQQCPCLVFLAIVTIFLLSGSDISFREPSFFSLAVGPFSSFLFCLCFLLHRLLFFSCGFLFPLLGSVLELVK